MDAQGLEGVSRNPALSSRESKRAVAMGGALEAEGGRQRGSDGATHGARGHRFKSVAVTLLALVAHAAAQGKEGDWCLNDDGYDGICRHLRYCPYLQNKAEVFNSAGPDTPHLCSYGNGGTIVCCPTSPPPSPPPSVATQAAAPTRRPTTRPISRPSIRKPVSRPTPAPTSAAPAAVAPALRISEKMCHQYLNSLDDATTQLRADSDLSEPWCPYPPPSNELIVGGLNANSGEYPHMAALGYLGRGQVNWHCGGSLISPTYVLTAAHCLSGSLIAVSLGTLRVSNMSVVAVKQMIAGAGVSSHIYPVAEGLRHPKFSQFSHYNDIALVRLDVPVRTFDLYVRPACLHEDTSMEGIARAVACGFGHTKFKDPSLTRSLRYVTLDVYGSEVCSQVFSAVIRTSKLSQGILDSQVCSGQLAGGEDTCDGDSGGPLQMRDAKDKCITRIIGVTSFGAALCGSKNTAGLYTSVAHYLPWIESVVWPEAL